MCNSKQYKQKYQSSHENWENTSDLKDVFHELDHCCWRGWGVIFGIFFYTGEARVHFSQPTLTAGSSELVSRSKVIGGGKVCPSLKKKKLAEIEIKKEN